MEKERDGLLRDNSRLCAELEEARRAAPGELREAVMLAPMAVALGDTLSDAEHLQHAKEETLAAKTVQAHVEQQLLDLKNKCRDLVEKFAASKKEAKAARDEADYLRTQVNACDALVAEKGRLLFDLQQNRLELAAAAQAEAAAHMAESANQSEAEAASALVASEAATAACLRSELATVAAKLEATCAELAASRVAAKDPAEAANAAASADNAEGRVADAINIDEVHYEV